MTEELRKKKDYGQKMRIKLLRILEERTKTEGTMKEVKKRGKYFVVVFFFLLMTKNKRK